MIVTYYQRFPSEGYYSIEKIFREIQRALPNDIGYKVAISKYESRGVLKRILNCIDAIFRQGDINHITGDIHYVSLFLKKKRTIITIHDCGTLKRLRGLKKWIFYVFWYWLPEKRCKYITVVSEATKKELLKYLRCDEHKIRVIPNPIPKNYKYVPLNFNAKKPTILQVGTKPNKNLERVAEAINGISCELIIIGKLMKYQIRLLEKNNIQYTSYENVADEDLIKFYIKSDIVVFASTYEGFGMPIIEAQAIGRPVITSNISSMPEVAGNGACLVDPYNIDSIRNALIKIIKDDDYRNNLISNGLKNVERFRLEYIVNQYVELYKDVCRER